MKNFYDILGVPASAHEQEIKLAYRRLAKRYHPDVNAGDKKSEERFKEIVEAYNTLSDPILKSAYDRKRSGRDLFSNSGFSFDEKKEKRDPRKREYSEEELNHARAMHRKRTLAHIARRKKIFVGMIITFILVIIGGAELENYVEQQRQMNEDSLKKLLSFDVAKIRSEQNQFIENTDSPYDGFFGKAVYQPTSVNNIVIYNYFSDAVVCAVQLDGNSRTVRNEFMHPSIDPFVLRYLPNGIYSIKIYSGKSWDMKKKIPTGNVLGGFSSNEAFYKMDVKPFEFLPTTKQKKVQTSDTIWIDPRIMKMDSISRGEFFSATAK